jgi:NAD(P)-dependent dehydrogenase (short-subunit alcohol dehydrogenase family)
MAEPSSVLITGASTGIGRACSLWMDSLGWRVFAGVRQPADASTLSSEGSGRIQPIFLDVTDQSTITAAAAEIEATVGKGGLQGLVNNAGIAVGGLLEFLPMEQLRRQLDVNVVGQVAVTQALIPCLRRGGGRIVNMSSIAGFSASPVSGPYAASKHALEALSDALRLELRPWKIHVALIEPGKIQTPIWQKSLADVQAMLADYPPQAQELYGPLIEMGVTRVSKTKGIPAEKVAEAVAHALISDKPKIRYIVGKDAHIRLWLERLPDWIRDFIIASRMPKYG